MHFALFSEPDFTLDTTRMLAPGALAIALLGLIEALSIARAITIQSKQHINGNQEFIGQGLSNVAGSFFSAYASPGYVMNTWINSCDSRLKFRHTISAYRRAEPKVRFDSKQRIDRRTVNPLRVTSPLSGGVLTGVPSTAREQGSSHAITTVLHRMHPRLDRSS